MISVPYTTPAPRPAAAGSASTVSGSSAFAGTAFVPQTPSHWVHDSARSACSSCRAQFSFFSRRHHCRVCRELFCDSCSDYRLLTRDPKDRTTIVSVRACRACFDKHKGSKTRGTPKGAKPRAAARPAGSAQTRPAPAAPPTTVTAQSVTVGTPVFNLTTAEAEKGGFYVQRQSSNAQQRPAAVQEEAVEVQLSADDAEQDDGDGDDDSELDVENFTGQIFEDDEEEDEAADAFPAPTVDVPLNSGSVSGSGAELYKETARILPTPPHAKTVELEVLDGGKAAMTAGSRPSMEGKGAEERGGRAVEKDEFERDGDNREAQQQILNIPADALASVRHSNSGQQQPQHRPAAVLHSEEAAVYSERNVEKRYVVPPSPVTGVADLLQLASPSAVPQPLLNALNDSRTKPEDLARVAQAPEGVSVSQPVFPPATAAAGSSSSILTPRQTNSLLAKAAQREPPVPPSQAAVSPSPADVHISRFVPAGSSTASFSTRKEGQSEQRQRQQEEQQPGLSTSGSSSRVNPTVPVPAWPATGAASPAGASARTPRVSASTVDPPAALYDPMDAVVEGAAAISAAPRPEARQRRLVLKKRRTQRTPVGEFFSKLMRPLPLLGLAVLLLAFLAIFPLPVTIAGTLLLASVPVLYSFLYSKRQAASDSMPRVTVSAPQQQQQPVMSAAAQALSDWDRAEQRMDGLAAMPSPSLTRHYASQTEAETEDSGPVVREKAADRETATASVSRQMAPRPKVVI